MRPSRMAQITLESALERAQDSTGARQLVPAPIAGFVSKSDGGPPLYEVPRALWVCRQTVSVGECLTDENWGRSEERFVRTLQVEQRIVFE